MLGDFSCFTIRGFRIVAINHQVTPQAFDPNIPFPPILADAAHVNRSGVVGDCFTRGPAFKQNDMFGGGVPLAVRAFRSSRDTQNLVEFVDEEAPPRERPRDTHHLDLVEILDDGDRSAEIKPASPQAQPRNTPLDVPWHDVWAKHVPRLVTNADLIIKQLVLEHASRQHITSDDLRDARVEFRTYANLKHITGKDIPLPTLLFDDADTYARLMTRMGYQDTSGITLMINSSRFCAALGFHCDVALPPRMGIIVVCTRQLSYSPGNPEQIMFHEATHAADPNLGRYEDYQNTEAFILSEMAATIGEGADLGHDHYTVRVVRSFWGSYLEKAHLMHRVSYAGEIPYTSPALTRLLRLEKPKIIDHRLTDAVIACIQRITLTNSNADLVRMIYRSRSFAEFTTALEARYRHA
ncbi:MAG: hypothetical protein HQM16_13365 [Deltaproteobacteria bacterium]|nr:hypothetical protein [Deltaproteobacteria bacterium]